jgi:protoporphyrinogen oxidase
MTGKTRVHIIGAGPAGLSAARELIRNERFQVEILEQTSLLGGISRTEMYKHYRIDIGGHRFFTKYETINTIWEETLGSDFLHVQRSSRIYYKGKFLRYPLQPLDTILHLGPAESVLVCLSYLQTFLLPVRDEQTFEQWTINRFGKRLYNTFFKEYTEKIWGMPCSSIQAEWAAQRIKGLSLSKAVINAVFGTNGPKSLIESFRYPRLGPGMMWERFSEDIASRGGNVRLESSVTALHHTDGTIHHLGLRKKGEDITLQTDQVLSTMPLSRLVSLLQPKPPADVLQAAAGLLYRDFIIVVLIIDQKTTFPDQWLYIHSPEVSVGRIQNFKNWSADMVPDENTTSLGMEYFCNRQDPLWQMTDRELVHLAAVELEKLGISNHCTLLDACVIRQPFAYPVYDTSYRSNLDKIKSYLLSFNNLQTVGRNGMHRYNNMDHSMLTGIQAAQNLKGANHDPWLTENEYEYIEENPRLKN